MIAPQARLILSLPTRRQIPNICAVYRYLSWSSSTVTSTWIASRPVPWDLILAEFNLAISSRPPNRQRKNVAKFSRYTVVSCMLWMVLMSIWIPMHFCRSCGKNRQHSVVMCSPMGWFCGSFWITSNPSLSYLLKMCVGRCCRERYKVFFILLTIAESTLYPKVLLTFLAEAFHP